MAKANWRRSDDAEGVGDAAQDESDEDDGAADEAVDEGGAHPLAPGRQRRPDWPWLRSDHGSDDGG